MYSYKITSLTLNDGTIIKPAALTVLIGPNNVGKSQALKDIANLTSRLAQAPRDGVIIKRISSQLPQSVAAFLEAYPSLARVRDKSGAMHYNGLNTTLTDYYRISGGSDPRENERDFASQNSTEKKHEWISSEFGMGLIAFLTTEHRLQLVKEANNSDHDDGADNLLQAFYNAGSAKAQDVSNQVSQVFREKRIALDFTTGRKLRIRVASDFSDVPPDPRDARAIMQSKLLLDEQGDGIRSFVGMVVALETLDRPLILIDEPEAFLHPPQAYAIGRFIAEEARTGRQIIVATHSTDVLRGITSVTPNADIIRIDRVNDANSFRALSQKKLKEVILDPLLSSSRVLDGLFYPGAIITEGDRDSRFFQAVLQKLPGTIDTHFGHL